MRILAAILLFLLTIAFAEAQTIRLPEPFLKQALDKAECDIEFEEANKEFEFAGVLGGPLKLLEVPCWRAAYNFGSIFFAIDPARAQDARLLQFQRPDEKNQLALTYQLSNAAYDEAKKVLSSFHKGRGVGDCGTAGNWRWNGKEFVLMHYWNKNSCDGEPFFDDLDPPNKFLVYPPKNRQNKK